MLLVAQGIHWLPESTMNPGGELAARGKMLHGLVFPYRIQAVDQFEHARFQHEKAAVDEPAFGLRLLFERLRSTPLDHDPAEPRRGAHAGYSGLATSFLVKGDLLADIDIRQSIAVGHAKGFAGIQVLADLHQASAGH